MPEYIIRVNEDNSIDLPAEVMDKLALEPSNKIIMRFDSTGEHMVLGKLPMDMMEKAPEINNALGQKVKIKE